MSFAQPLAWLWLTLAVPIVIFYILKIRLRRVPVSTLMFWRKIYDEKQPRSLWQKLRHLLSLLLQLLFLLLLTAALVDPHFAWESLQSRRIVIVLDNSASMRATDVTPSRFEAARQAITRILDGVRFHDEISLVAAATQPRVVCGMTTHARTLRDALESIPPTDGPTRLEDGVALARRLIGDSPRGKIYVVSDGGSPGAEKLASEPDVEWIGVGTRTANLGITRFQVRRSLLDPIAYQTLLEARNAADEKVDARLTLTLAGELVDVVPLSLAPGETISRVFDSLSAAGGELVAELEHNDTLVTDNRAAAILPERRQTRVSLATAPNLFLEKVIEANPLVALKVARPGAPLAAADVTVFHRDVPATLPPGPVFVIDPRNKCDLWDVGATIASPIVAKQDKDSLLMTHVRLDNVVLPEARTLSIPGGVHSLVTAVTGEMLYGMIRRDTGPVLVLPVNLDEGDLTLRTTFPILFTNALSQLTGGKDDLRPALASGEIATITAAEIGSAPGASQPAAAEAKGEDAAPVPVLVSPSGAVREYPREANQWSVGPLDEIGLWRFGWRDVATPPTDGAPAEATPKVAVAGGVTLAVNLADRDESDLRVPESLLARDAAATASSGWGLRSPWYYAALLAWILIVIEWCLYQRRWIT